MTPTLTSNRDKKEHAGLRPDTLTSYDTLIETGNDTAQAIMSQTAGTKKGKARKTEQRDPGILAPTPR